MFKSSKIGGEVATALVLVVVGAVGFVLPQGEGVGEEGGGASVSRHASPGIRDGISSLLDLNLETKNQPREGEGRRATGNSMGTSFRISLNILRSAKGKEKFPPVR